MQARGRCVMIPTRFVSAHALPRASGERTCRVVLLKLLPQELELHTFNMPWGLLPLHCSPGAHSVCGIAWMRDWRGTARRRASSADRTVCDRTGTARRWWEARGMPP